MSYAIEDRGVRYSNDCFGGAHSSHFLEGVDLASFQILNRTWAKDRKSVWSNGQKIRKVNALAFEALNAAFGRDNECVFESSGRLLKGMSPSAFEVLDDGEGDYASGRTGEASYARHDGKIFRYGRFDHRTMWLRGADAATFKALKWSYGCDELRVYYGSLVLHGAKAATYRQITPFFSADDRQVFYFNRVVPRADPKTFYVFDQDFWKTAVLGNTPINWGYAWAKDEHRVYYHDRLVVDGDPLTSEPVGCYLKDHRHLYGTLGKKLPVADIASLEAIGRGVRYFRDRQHIYYNSFSEWKALEGADLETLHELPRKHPSGGDAWDKNWIYRDGERLKPRSDFSG